MDSISTNESNLNNGHQVEAKALENLKSEEYIFNNDSTKDIVDEIISDRKTNKATKVGTSSIRKRSKMFTFETNSTLRKRIRNRLLSKIRKVVDEFAMRCGYQIVVLVAPPNEPATNYKVFGTQPLENVVYKLRSMIMEGLEDALTTYRAPSPMETDNPKFDLPPLRMEGMPLVLDKMTQAQLRAFIPLILKYSMGRGKPGWGKMVNMPTWWPIDLLPWENIRIDNRDATQRDKMTWTEALRNVVRRCYKYHGREDLLYPCDDLENLNRNIKIGSNELSPIYTVANDNGTLTIYQIDQSATNNAMPLTEQMDVTQSPITVTTMPEMQEVQKMTGTELTGACKVIDFSTVKEAYYQNGQLFIVDGEAGQEYSFAVNMTESSSVGVVDPDSNINSLEYNTIPKIEIQ